MYCCCNCCCGDCCYVESMILIMKHDQQLHCGTPRSRQAFSITFVQGFGHSWECCTSAMVDCGMRRLLVVRYLRCSDVQKMVLIPVSIQGVSVNLVLYALWHFPGGLEIRYVVLRVYAMCICSTSLVHHRVRLDPTLLSCRFQLRETGFAILDRKVLATGWVLERGLVGHCGSMLVPARCSVRILQVVLETERMHLERLLMHMHPRAQ
jgi:hypothetical protein